MQASICESLAHDTNVCLAAHQGVLPRDIREELLWARRRNAATTKLRHHTDGHPTCALCGTSRPGSYFLDSSCLLSTTRRSSKRQTGQSSVGIKGCSGCRSACCWRCGTFWTLCFENPIPASELEKCRVVLRNRLKTGIDNLRRQSNFPFSPDATVLGLRKEIEDAMTAECQRRIDGLPTFVAKTAHLFLCGGCLPVSEVRLKFPDRIRNYHRLVCLETKGTFQDALRQAGIERFLLRWKGRVVLPDGRNACKCRKCVAPRATPPLEPSLVTEQILSTQEENAPTPLDRSAVDRLVQNAWALAQMFRRT